MSLTEEQIIEARKAANCYQTSSLDAALASEDEGTETALADRIGEEDPSLELVVDFSSLAPMIAGLGERDRQIIHMRFVEELTQAQIAARLDVSQMHVSRLISRIIKRLRTGLLGPAVA
jgi:RNA polymerase sigma-B factor